MEPHARGNAPGEVLLRPVTAEDLPIFFEQQRDPLATAMAAFPARERAAFMAHWSRILADASMITQTILYDGRVAGNIGSWNQGGERDVGYWLGQAYWGQGIATRALAEFLRQVTVRPLYAHVVKHNIGSLRVLEKCGFTLVGENPGGTVAGGEEGEEFILILPAHEPGAAP